MTVVKKKIILYNPEAVFFDMPLALMTIGSKGPWVSDKKYTFFERYKFYIKAAYGKSKLVTIPFKGLAQIRCKTNFYAFPFEKKYLN